MKKSRIELVKCCRRNRAIVGHLIQLTDSKADDTETDGGSAYFAPIQLLPSASWHHIQYASEAATADANSILASRDLRGAA